VPVLLSNCSSSKTNELPGLVNHYKEKYPDYKKKQEEKPKEKKANLETEQSALVKKIGKINQIEKRILIRRNGKTIHMQESELELMKEDQVFSDNAGKARILLTEGAEVFLAPSSNVYFNIHFINSLIYEHELKLKGKLRAKVNLAKRRRFIIKTAQANVVVKGTDVVVDASRGITKVAALEGNVEVFAPKTKQRVEITVNKQVSISSEGQVSKPQKVEPELIKDLEHSGTTGIKELDELTNQEETTGFEQKDLIKKRVERNQKISNASFLVSILFGYSSIIQRLEREANNDRYKSCRELNSESACISYKEKRDQNMTASISLFSVSVLSAILAYSFHEPSIDENVNEAQNNKYQLKYGIELSNKAKLYISFSKKWK